MKTMHFCAAIAALAILFSACEQPQPEAPAKPDLAQLRTEIQTMEDAYAAAQNAKDAAAIANNYYAKDAVSLPPNKPMVSGRAAILKNTQEEFASDTSNTTISFEVVDVFADGDLAVEVGRSVSKDAAGNTVSTGKYISVFEKRDGKYICIRDIYNDDAARSAGQ